MRKLKVFISSVQSEFTKERKSLADYIRHDVLLSQFFEPFLFEEVPANNDNPAKVYLSEVAGSDIYVGLMGQQYGYQDEDGISPTEHEYYQAKKANIQRWIYIKEATDRHRKELNFIRKIEQDVSRKMFSNLNTLNETVYHSCIKYLQQKGFISANEFDSNVNQKASVEELDLEVINDFVVTAKAKRNFPFKESDSAVKVLTALNLLRDGELVNSSLLVFSNNPQQYFPSAIVKCAHFHGVSVQKPIPDFKEFRGSILNMANNTVDFILSKISMSTGERDNNNIVETAYEVPRAAIAEAVINAVVHRDYTSNGSVQVSVFNDRIEIVNPGQLPPELSIEDLKIAHTSYPKNPLLAECMFQYGAIERYGTGTIDMLRLTNEKGLKDPDFSLEEGFKVTLWRPSASTIHDTIHDTIYVFKDLSDLTHRLVLIMIGEMSRTEMMALLELRNRAHFAQNYLEKAMTAGLIEMTLPNTPKSKKQKYRLTNKGIKLQNMIKNS